MTDRILSLLRSRMTGYWGERLLSEFDFLHEYIRSYDRADFQPLLDAAVSQTQDLLDREGAIARDAALKIEETLLPASATLKQLRVNCIGHAHIDMNWMWRFDETVSITVETVRTMLMLMREYPTFTFGQSQASIYRILEEYAPELLPELRERIREGRWEVTASTWVEADKNMINGESLSRHLLYTRAYLKDLLGLSDDDFKLDFEPDTFGHSVNVPEVLTQAGVQYYYHCRGHEGDHAYRWRSPSGAELTVFMEPTWYNETIDGRSFIHVPSFCARYGVTSFLDVFGVGDHGGGATRRDIERILDMNTWPCYPTVGFGTYRAFFRELEKSDLPVVTGELNFIFTGCYTTETRIKRANRIGEAALYESEAMSAAAARLTGLPYPAKRFMEAWENVLFNHFHDILPGSGVTDTREYALGQFQKSMAIASQAKVSAARALAQAMNTSSLVPEEEDRFSISEGAGGGYGVENFQVTLMSPTRGLHRLYNLFNATQYDRRSLTELTVWDWQGSMDAIEVTDETGKPVDFQLLDAQKKFYWGHEYFRLLVDAEVPGFGYRTLVVAPADRYVAATNAADERLGISATHILENECVRAEFDPDTAQLVRLLDKKTGAELLDGPAGFRFIEESTAAGMTAWRVGRYSAVRPVVENVRVREIIDGPLMQGFRYECTVAHSKLNVTVSLGRHDRLVRLETSVEWRELGTAETFIPQLQYYIPVRGGSGKTAYDVLNGELIRDEYHDDVPALSYGAALTGEGGLMLTSDSKYGFRSWNGGLSLTLIRSSYNPDTTPEVSDHRFTLGVGPAAADRRAEALTFCIPVLPIAVAPSSGTLPPCGQLLKANGVAVSGIKLAEDGSGRLVLHAYAVQDGEASITFSSGDKKAYFCDVHEHPGEAIDLSSFPVQAGRSYQFILA